MMDPGDLRTIPPPLFPKALTNFLDDLDHEYRKCLREAGKVADENIDTPNSPPKTSTTLAGPSKDMNTLSEIMSSPEGREIEIQNDLLQHFNKKRALSNSDTLDQDAAHISKSFPEITLARITELLAIFVDFPNRVEVVLRLLVDKSNCNDTPNERVSSLKRLSEEISDVPKKMMKLSEPAEIEQNNVETLFPDLTVDMIYVPGARETPSSSVETVIFDEQDVQLLVSAINRINNATEPASSASEALSAAPSSSTTTSNCDKVETKKSEIESKSAVIKPPIFDVEVMEAQPSTSKDISKDSTGMDDNGGSFSLIDYLHEITKSPKKRIAECCRNLNLAIDEKPSDFQLGLIIDCLLNGDSNIDDVQVVEDVKKMDKNTIIDLSESIEENLNGNTPKTYDSDVMVVPSSSTSRIPSFKKGTNLPSNIPVNRSCSNTITSTEATMKPKKMKKSPNEAPSTSTSSQSVISSTAPVKADPGSIFKSVESLAESSTAVGTTEPPVAPVPENSQEVDAKLLKSLCQVFPDVSSTYLKKICAGKPYTDESLNDLVTFIIELNGKYPRRPAPQPEPDNIEVQYEIIKEVLPDADPDFLQMTCDKYSGRPDDFRAVIDGLMENRNYPTLKDYQRRQQLSAQQRQYTSEFSVENFVKLFPDPEKVFNDKSRKVQVDNLSTHYAVLFLRNHFERMHVRTIQDVYGKSACSLINAATCLENLSKDPKFLMKSRRKEAPLPNITNIPLLQEIAYISHKTEILGYLKKKKENEEILRLEVKEAGLMKTCNCCYDDEVMPNEVFTCTEGCEFCKNCVIKSVEVLFGEGKLEYPCLSSCKAKFSIQTLQSVLPPKLFSKVAQKKALEEVKAAGISDLEMCPFCDFATILSETDKVFKCFNPECMKESCRLCKEPSHIPLRCDEIEKDQDVQARTFIENKMTEALLRKCWSCGIKFYKVEGCNKMTCSCGAHMCYICKQPVKDYTHFNGQGGDKHHLCPLYSDSDELNRNNVLKGAAAAKTEIGVKELKIDPTLNFPQTSKPPPATPHAHQQYGIAVLGAPLQQVYHGGYPVEIVDNNEGAARQRADREQRNHGRHPHRHYHHYHHNRF